MALVRVSRQCQFVSIKSVESDIIFRKHLIAYNFIYLKNYIFKTIYIVVLQIGRGNRDNLGSIFYVGE